MGAPEGFRSQSTQGRASNNLATPVFLNFAVFVGTAGHESGDASTCEGAGCQVPLVMGALATLLPTNHSTGMDPVVFVIAAGTIATAVTVEARQGHRMVPFRFSVSSVGSDITTPLMSIVVFLVTAVAIAVGV
jgi:hypothetical protein